MPWQQLELAPGELVKLEARSKDDLPADADGGRRANLLMVGDGLQGGDSGGPEGVGLLAPRGGWIPACRGPLSPPVVREVIVRFLLLAAAGVREKCDLRSDVPVEILRFKCVSYCSQSLRKASCACSERLG